MPTSSSAQTVVKLAQLTELAGAVPHLLGFHPTESLVAVALRGRRDRLGFTMRVDLLPAEHDADVAGDTAARMAHAGAEAVLLVVYTEGPDIDGDLPRRELVTAVESELVVPLRDALLVRAGRVWSYVCADERCCPAAGTILRSDTAGAVALAAAQALRGDVVLPDRAALVATTRPVGGVAAVSMEQAMERAVVAVVRSRAEPVAAGCALIDALCARYDDPRATMTHDEAAELAVRLRHVAFRDRLLARLAADDEVLARVVADLARLAQPPGDAPAATMLAMAAYLRGDGVVAMAAAERALASDAGYSLARLVVDCLERQLDPGEIRRAWRAHLP
jgi:hypothetical protein